jgi:hypothetical protein
MQVLTSRVLRSIVIDYLKHSIEREDVAIIYIYCSYKEKDDQTAANLIASLLQQLVQISPVVSGEILSLYDYHTKNGTRPALGELSRLLQLESRRFSKVFVLIDALDECPESSYIRTSLLRRFGSYRPAYICWLPRGTVQPSSVSSKRRAVWKFAPVMKILEDILNVELRRNIN